MIWRQLDIVPLRLPFKDKSDLAEMAISNSYKAGCLMDSSSAPSIRVTQTSSYAVCVDGDGGRLRYVTLDEYRPFCDTWDELTGLARGPILTFISSTKQGGGVALMRHALIRFLNLMGVEACWFALKANPLVFDITKKKFHNCLQGVAQEKIDLSAADKKLHETWCRSNWARITSRAMPHLNRTTLFIVDDPQPTAIIPMIREQFPNAKLAYRSHIQLRKELIDQAGTDQAKVWDYLFNGKVSLADYFIAHPLKDFVPKKVAKDKVIFAPATTDPLDGLNKPLTSTSLAFYQSCFSQICQSQCGHAPDWNRAYIVQIARFDPSKGIPDVLQAFKALRKLRPDDMPQLHCCWTWLCG